MNDDLNTSVALSVLFDLVRKTNTLLEGDKATAATLKAIETLFMTLGGDVLGIVTADDQALGAAPDSQQVGTLVELLIEQRACARQAKDFATSDRIRDRLAEIGILLKDKPGSTDWSFK